MEDAVECYQMYRPRKKKDGRRCYFRRFGCTACGKEFGVKDVMLGRYKVGALPAKDMEETQREPTGSGVSARFEPPTSDGKLMAKENSAFDTEESPASPSMAATLGGARLAKTVTDSKKLPKAIATATVTTTANAATNVTAPKTTTSTTSAKSATSATDATSATTTKAQRGAKSATNAKPAAAKTTALPAPAPTTAKSTPASTSEILKALNQNLHKLNASFKINNAEKNIEIHHLKKELKDTKSQNQKLEICHKKLIARVEKLEKENRDLRRAKRKFSEFAKEWLEDGGGLRGVRKSDRELIQYWYVSLFSKTR